MKRAATTILAMALGAASLACATAPARPVASRLDGLAEAPGLVGDYRCAFQQSGVHHAGFHCRITAEGAELRLEKVGGPQRMRGRIMLREDGGFDFEGELAFPASGGSAHPQAVTGAFAEGQHHGEWAGQLSDDEHTIVMLTRVHGNASYGGEGYGEGGDIPPAPPCDDTRPGNRC